MKRTAMATALVLSLTLALPVAAADAQISESFSVVRTLSVTLKFGATAPTTAGSFDYGPIEAGSLSESTEYMVLVGNGGESAWNLSVSGTDFIGPNGATISADARQARFGGATVVPGLGGDHSVNGTPILVAQSDANSGSDLAVVQVSQWIDLAFVEIGPSGDYSGVTTWTVSAP
jgi:hypothetical protein